HGLLALQGAVGPELGEHRHRHALPLRRPPERPRCPRPRRGGAHYSGTSAVPSPIEAKKAAMSWSSVRIATPEWSVRYCGSSIGIPGVRPEPVAPRAVRGVLATPTV